MLQRDYDVETAIGGFRALEALRKAEAIHESMLSDLNAGYLTKPLPDCQVLEAAARALGAPAA